jgi:hypothetical protein
MDSINRPAGGDPHDPYRYKIEEIQKDRSDQKNFQKEPKKPPKKNSIAAHFLLLLHKVLEWLTPR